MRQVKFPFITNTNGGIEYPDNISLFANTDVIDGVVYGDYFGSDNAILNGTKPINDFKTRVTLGELTILIQESGYAKIYRAAYPQGNKPEDNQALYFLEQVKNPTSDDGLIDVLDLVVTDSLDHFVVNNYINSDDKLRIQQGYPNK